LNALIMRATNENAKALESVAFAGDDGAPEAAAQSTRF